MLPYQSFERRDSGLVGLDQVGGLRLIIERAGLVLAQPNANQIARDVVAFRQAVSGLAGEVLLHDLALELDAVTTVRGYGAFTFGKPGGPGQVSSA